MIELNLTAIGTEQKLLKDYLENNVSEILADKINNGVKIVKDDKTLINKKALETFMKYACEEARKLANKNANSACVKDDIVFGWAIHYFEEDSLEGVLYNEDGTEYIQKPKPKLVDNEKLTIKEKEKTLKPQASMFDLMDNSAIIKTEETEIVNEEIEDEQEFVESTNKQIQADNFEELPQNDADDYVDTETGEVLSVNTVATNVTTDKLKSILGDMLIVR